MVRGAGTGKINRQNACGVVGGVFQKEREVDHGRGGGRDEKPNPNTAMG